MSQPGREVFVVPLGPDTPGGAAGATMVIYKENDSRYEGMVKGKGLRDGFGTLSWIQAKTSAQGHWASDSPDLNTKWKLVYPVREDENGERLDIPQETYFGHIQFRGRLIPNSPTALPFDCFVRHGLGEHTSHDSTFYGFFKNGVRQGHGLYINFSRRIQFYGRFESGMFHGRGLLRDIREGTLYAGEFSRGAMTGEGEYFLLRNRICLRGTFHAVHVPLDDAVSSESSVRLVQQGLKNGRIFPNCVPDETSMWNLLHDVNDSQRAVLRMTELFQTEFDELIRLEEEGGEEREEESIVNQNELLKQTTLMNQFIGHFKIVEFFVAFFQLSYFQKDIFFDWAVRDIASFVKYIMSLYSSIRKEALSSFPINTIDGSNTKRIPLPSWEIGLEFVMSRVGDALMSTYRTKYKARDVKFLSKLQNFPIQQLIENFMDSYSIRIENDNYSNIVQLLLPNSQSILNSLTGTTNVLRKIRTLELLRETVIQEILPHLPSNTTIVSVDLLTELFILLLSHCNMEDFYAQFNLINDIINAFYARYASSAIMSVKNLVFGFIKYIEKTYECRMYMQAKEFIQIKRIVGGGEEEQEEEQEREEEQEGEEEEGEGVVDEEEEEEGEGEVVDDVVVVEEEGEGEEEGEES